MWSSACVWLARGSNRQEEQVAPRRVLPGWWVTIGGRCPFTIHVPSVSADSDCVSVTQREQREGGRRPRGHVGKPTAHFQSCPPLHSRSRLTALTDLAPVPVVNYTTVILVWYYASSAFINGGNKFGEQNLDLSPARFNLHKPTSVLQHKVEGLAQSPQRLDVTLCQFNLAYQFME